MQAPGGWLGAHHTLFVGPPLVALHSLRRSAPACYYRHERMHAHTPRTGSCECQRTLQHSLPPLPSTANHVRTVRAGGGRAAEAAGEHANLQRTPRGRLHLLSAAQ